MPKKELTPGEAFDEASIIYKKALRAAKREHYDSTAPSFSQLQRAAEKWEKLKSDNPRSAEVQEINFRTARFRNFCGAYYQFVNKAIDGIYGETAYELAADLSAGKFSPEQYQNAIIKKLVEKAGKNSTLNAIFKGDELAVFLNYLADYIKDGFSSLGGESKS